MRLWFANDKKVFCLVSLFWSVEGFSSSSTTRSTTTTTTTPWSHAAMREFDERLTAMEQGTAPESLQSFYEPQLKSFSVEPGASRFSITSTCYALQAIMATENPSLYENLIAMDPSIAKVDDSYRTPVQQILRAILASDWRKEDLFQVPVLLYTVLQVDARRSYLGRVDAQTAARIRSLLESVLKARPRRRDGLRQVYSDYILFQCTLVYAQVYDGAVCSPPGDFFEREVDYDEDRETERSATDTNRVRCPMSGLPQQAIPDGTPSEVALSLARCAENSYNTLCREIALRSAGAEFDVMRLAYSLLTYVVATQRLAYTAGRELIPGQGPSAGSRIRPVNRKLIQAGLAAFFDEQNDDGLWDKGQPIYRSFRKTGRNIGNAFIFAVDTVSSLLEHLPAEDFRPHLSELRRVLDWIEFHHKVEILPDYCDPETGQCTGKAIQGWSSPHLSPDTSPQAWSTAQTVACISRMKTVVETLMHDDVLVEFNGMKLSQKGAISTSWDRLLDADLGKCGFDRTLTLKEVLHDRMISPRIKDEDDSVLSESYSAILFGPPGTAKTTIAQSLAERIGYDFLLADVPVDPATKEQAMQTYESFLSSFWDEDAKYMNYIEGVKFAGACANVVAKGSSLTNEAMSEILKSQTAVMTVRGSVRKEFDASMDMTRL
eukprot:scaffold6331_cov152-Amphora_coffeaeformis.AAC.4